MYSGEVDFSCTLGNGCQPTLHKDRIRFLNFSSRRKSANPTIAPSDFQPSKNGNVHVHLIVKSDDIAFLKRLEVLSGENNWRMSPVFSVEQAGNLLQVLPSSVVIWEHDTPIGEWRNALLRMSELPRKPCILLAPEYGDDLLFEEVFRRRGYDVLHKSATDQEMAAKIRSASLWRRFVK